ncbi:TAT-variant-translocated molybdopterin oxidoreductase [Roseiconus lacunae]|uniref:TAT-variant-translocated molybdopterin oxidoreductase n=1 Tax=Roseiconus lacunae TaxID=2605694 RepID=A0ABT7PQG6_9BACT|nr:TAT-variant-translocated molybdopterin oxidoreductase [Roseiconus lacunae]MDM4018695.1 TAT-variant-translocated molybdopterin oxidoreductase [Roseiconus lacunae]
MTQKQSSENSQAPNYWRSLSEYHGSSEFKENFLHREFPVAASEFPEGVSRRRWMQLMGASLAMAGVAGCRYPEEVIAPFVIRPEGRVPGEFYDRATNIEIAGGVHNLLIRCFDGRPQHVETNPSHPSSAGTNTYVQASILSLYDPDRSRGDDGPVLKRIGDARKQETSWEDFLAVGRAAIKKAASNGDGKGFALLTSPTASPTTARLIGELQAKLPQATIATMDTIDGGMMRQATKTMLGTECDQALDLSEAKVIFVLGGDPLGSDPGSLLASQSFAKKRDPKQGEMSRLYVAEAGYSVTGTMADTRLAVRPSQMPAMLAEVARAVEKLNAGESHDHPADELPFNHPDITASERQSRFIDCLAHDIVEAGDKAVVIVGSALGAETVAAGIEMNQKLGSLGSIQSFTPCVDRDLDTKSIGELVQAIDAGDIETLLIAGGNPVVTAPGDIDITSAIDKVEQTFYLGEYDDETAVICNWSLPLAHPLESWGDTVNLQGFYGVGQPQILPLMGGRTLPEVIALMIESDETDPMMMVRRTAGEVAGQPLKEREWRQLLHDGFADAVKGQAGITEVSGSAKPLPENAPAVVTPEDIDPNDFEVVFTVADGLYDGRFANNGWLQELPQPITKLTWGNAALVGPGTAKKLGVKHGYYVTLRRGERKVELPVYEVPGIAPGVVTVSIGYGRTRAGMVGGMTDHGIDAVGIDVSPIRTADAMSVAYGVEARPNYNEYDFATTQNHWAIDELGRKETERRSYNLVREGTVELLDKVPTFANEQPKAPHVPKVGEYGSLQYEPIQEIRKEEAFDFVPQWGMAVDLSKCMGCNACVVACQSENNVPIVGAEQVRNSREMHWLRIDTYFQGDADDAQVVHQPMACLHCETAPCEQVCPVAATVHTNEGLNAMAYNRCIGTRYCANNCPVKVRRFNYFNYNEDVGVGYGVKAYPGSIESANRKLQALVLNPEVTVRGRGVMEKCTYCVQRIEKAKIAARQEHRSIQDSEITSACQAACSTDAISFGNIDDPNSDVAKMHADNRAYGLLEQLNIKPRTMYLARIRNPHPRLKTVQQITDLETIESHHGHGDHGHDDEHGHGSDGHGSDDHHDAKASGDHGDDAH